MSKMRRGGRSPAASSSSSTSMAHVKAIARDIEALGLASSFDADDVVSHLRSRLPHRYLRQKVRPLTAVADRALHLLRASSPSSPSAGALENNSDGSTSTSDVEPEFDVTSSLLRDKYAKLRAAKPAPAPAPNEEKNMEIESANEKKKRTLGSPEENGGASGKGDVAVGREGPRFRDLGGMRGVIEELMMEVIVPLCHPQLPRWLGVRPMAGILLHGPPGCGKTKLAHAIANETGVPFYKISATEVVSGVSGASEENIRDLFKKAYRTAPSIVFIDEIDAIASKRENLQREMERRIVTQLMTCMDESHQTLRSEDTDPEPETSEKKPGYVLVIGATNRPDAVDQALRRPGRFDREIALGVPDENGRLEILSVLTQNLRLEGEFNLMKIARSTPGFVGADLAALVNKAGNLAMKRIMDRRKSDISCKLNGEKVEDWWRQPWSPEEIDSLSIIMPDFEEAIKMVQPSSRREGFSSIPSTKWEDVGGLKSLRKEFDRYIVQRIKNPEDYEELGVNMEVGFLLYGPPGCGKTLIAKAVANEAGANFIHIKGPELLNKYVGESELAVRTIFSRARTCSPCIIFFDEVDALTTMRGKDGGWVVERLLNQLLIELDGADQRQGVYVIGATNRLEVMDPAVLRPGRFGRVLYVPLPSAEERGLIMKALAKNKPIAADVDLIALGHKEACRNLTGADLSAVMNEAAMSALEEKQMSMDNGTSYSKPLIIKTSHFEKAMGKITPSVSEKQISYYETMSKRYRGAGIEDLDLTSTSTVNNSKLGGFVGASVA
ncbi:cell division control protein 48-like protein C-like [Iris pallida]|uniref:Cell division control protein 48-like protein C-like n=1 Tax=Iris pallida TaxID=29817 RepID=A0AAX6DM53_IRIPA|nr:cell division control protein 48-like protein C-like [Iris pallida]